MLLVIMAIAVVAFTLSCVAIVLTIINKSDEENKRLDELEKRFEAIEQEQKNQSKDDTPQISEITPVDAFQISNYVGNDQSNVAELAIDGDVDTQMHKNSHTNPRWAADMGGIYHVKRVIVTNVRLGMGHTEAAINRRSTNLRVGVTNTKPVVGEDLALDAYTLCEEKPGYMGAVGNVTCPDGVTGQFVVVQFRMTEYMHIVEVKIYGFEDQL